MKKLSLFFYIILISAIFADYVNDTGNGQIVWTEKGSFIRATGTGIAPIIITDSSDPDYLKTHKNGLPIAHNMGQARILAIAAAKADAQRKLAEIVNGVKIDATTIVENYISTSDRVRTQVKSFIVGAREADIRYMSDGSVEVDMIMPLNGANGLSTILNTEEWGKGSFPKYEEAPVAKMIYTGLVIDCRGLNVKPAMNPKVYDEDGKIVYSSAVIDKNYALEQGIVGYAKDPIKAQNSDRVANIPFLVKAIAAKGEYNTDVVIHSEDAKNLLTDRETMNYLSQCRVIFVID